MKKKILALLCTICFCVVNFAVFTITSVYASDPKFSATDLKTSNSGNIFYDNKDVPDVSIDFGHNVTTTDNIRAIYTCNVVNENEVLVVQYQKTKIFNNVTAQKYTLNIPNPGKYGIYKLYVNVEAYPTLDASDKTYANYSTEFSVCRDMSANRDNSFGFNEHVARSSTMPADTAGTLMKRAGANWNRQTLLWEAFESTPGTYGVSETKLNRFLAYGPDNMVVCLSGRHPYYCTQTYNIKGLEIREAPHTEAQIAAFATFCGEAAKFLSAKGIHHYEVYNEWNVPTFNPQFSIYGAEYYARLLSAAYAAIKENDPDAVVIGGCFAADDRTITSHLGKILTEIANDPNYPCMDAFSIHKYPIAKNGYPAVEFVQIVNQIKSVLSTRVPSKTIPLWLTEFGFSTFVDSETGIKNYTEGEQLNNIVMTYALNKSEVMFDKILLYSLYEGNRTKEDANYDSTEESDNWGVVKRWEKGGSTEDFIEGAAKPAYLGIAAMEYFIGANATRIKKTMVDGNNFAFLYNNTENNKKVALVMNSDSDSTETKTIDFGTSSVEVYDKYGNHLNTMNGRGIVGTEYTLTITGEPMYIVGDFTKADFVEPSSEEDNWGMGLSAVLDTSNGNILISGISDYSNDEITICISDNGATPNDSFSNIVYVGQVTADSEGNFSVDVDKGNAQLTGTYIIYASSQKAFMEAESQGEEYVPVRMRIVLEKRPGTILRKNGIEVSENNPVRSGDRATVQLEGINPSSASKSKLIIAQYSGTSSMPELVSTKIVDVSGDFRYLGHEYYTDFVVDEDADFIRVLCWSFIDLSILCSPNTYLISD